MSGEIFIDVPNANALASHLLESSFTVQRRLISTTAKFGGLLLTQIMRNVTTGHHPPGRPHIPGTGPGPNVATGDYRRSWSMRMEVTARSAMAIVGTNAPQGPRLEYGFTGVDAAGRAYDQPPYPHAEPARDKVGVAYTTALASMLADVMKGKS